MFYSEEFTRFHTNLPPSKIVATIEEVFERIGRVEFFDRGEFEVSSSKFRSFATDVTVNGKLSKGRKEGEWSLRIEYSVKPSPLCWVIAIVGLLFLIGPIIFITPFLAKSEVQRAVERTVRDFRDSIENSN